MLWIMGLPRLILYWAGFDDLPLNILMFVYRIPLILADIAIFMILCRWLKQKIGLLLWLYWASPVLFYINYFHGQLDVIAMAIAFLSTYFLFTNRSIQFAIFLGLAVAAKMHLIVLIPFVLIYLWQNDRKMWTNFGYILISMVVFFSVNSPYIFSEGFINMVLLNSQQSKIGLITLQSSIDGMVIQLIPAILLLLVFYSVTIQIRNRDVFLFFIGSAFCVIILFIPPSQGWYYWVLPFLIYFYVRQSSYFIFPLLALQAAYFIYFAVIPESDFVSLSQINYLHKIDIFHDNKIINWKIDNAMITGLSFTLLQTFLLINTCLMLYRGVHVPQQSKLRARPYIIGIAGASGSGKSTLAANIKKVFGSKRVGIICGDDMHKWERGNERWKEFTHLNPIANELHHDLDILKQLHKNKQIYRRKYDHNNGQFTEKVEVNPLPIMITEGLHSFYLKPTRELCDLKIFIKPNQDLLQHRKIIRDVNKRNSTKENVIKSINERQYDMVKFIEVQESHADLIFSITPLNEIKDNDIGNKDLVISERLSITLSNSFSVGLIVSDLIEILHNDVHHYYDDKDQQIIEFNYPPEKNAVRALGEKHALGVEFFGIYDPPWSGGWDGVVQLFIAFCIFSDVGEES
ncbi:hypothetical protein N9B62_00405 [Amylibacter sp.]|nr:hypothetical protein [Amylibacter sp.]